MLDALVRGLSDPVELNQVEIWFSKVERDVIARGIFTSVNDLARKLRRYINAYSANASSGGNISIRPAASAVQTLSLPNATSSSQIGSSFVT